MDGAEDAALLTGIAGSQGPGLLFPHPPDPTPDLAMIVRRDPAYIPSLTHNPG